MVITGSVFKNRDLTVVDGIVNFMYNTLKENNVHQAHSGRELCRHIVKPLTMMTTQSPHQTVFIRLK